MESGELPPLVEKRLDELLARHKELEAEIADPEAHARPDFSSLTREFGMSSKQTQRYSDFLALRRQLAESDELLRTSGDDPEMRAMAREEFDALLPQVEAIRDELLDLILVGDKDSAKNVIVEIRAGTGGDEAALFAADLFGMYKRYADRRGWKVEAINHSPTPLGGYKEIIIGVSGDDVYRDLRYETGGHRVQRVPETETSGRIHTSAATVAVLGEPEEVEVDIKRSDLKIDTYRSSGPGGQNVNKTSSAVRITHLPTGIVVAIQEESSQHKNKSKAMRVLASRIYQQQETARREKEQNIRREQIGSGDRNQRVRTYNFPQNRVTDHRIGQNFNLEKVIAEGDLDGVVESLRGYEREARLKEL